MNASLIRWTWVRYMGWREMIFVVPKIRMVLRVTEMINDNDPRQTVSLYVNKKLRILTRCPSQSALTTIQRHELHVFYLFIWQRHIHDHQHPSGIPCVISSKTLISTETTNNNNIFSSYTLDSTNKVVAEPL